MKNEIVIKKISEIIADKIENDDEKGQCPFYPFFLKYYLYRFYKIDIDVNFGLIPNGNRYSPHNWNTYNGKLIDITIHKQLHDADYSAIILDEVYINKGNKKDIYYNHNELPERYLKIIQEASEESARNNRSNPEIERGLDADAVICKFERMNINDINKTKNLLKNTYKERTNAMITYMKTKETK